jgi:5-methylcytosine-specific restriction enzyme subunit McrC
MTKAWQPVFRQAAALMNGLYPDVCAGAIDGSWLLFDMERLFEAFVGAKIRHQWHGQNGRRIELQGPQRYFADVSNGPIFRMRPDITVATDSDRIERIYDTKWKQLDLTARDLGVSQTDIYQMASYAARYDCARLFLLYPRETGTGSKMLNTFRLNGSGGPTVEVYMLDLESLAVGGPLPNDLGPG